MGVVVRQISGDDWGPFRDLRLRALADSPDAFGITLAEAEKNGEADWRRRAEGPGPSFMAFVDEQPVAMGGLHAPEGSADAFVWGMWVDPEWRGRGLASRILHEVLNRAQRKGCGVVLHVTEGNDRARRLYEAHGFASTGEWAPLRDGSELRIEMMRWSPH
jgi:ribosomal protein S18 acetylase RimI-like enzyme